MSALEADFRVDVESSEDGPVVVVAGDVDLHTAPELREQLFVLADDGAERVLLDLSEVTFLDSMALGVLVGAKKRLEERGGRIDLVVPSPDVRRLFAITMLDEIFDLYETRDAARAGSAG